MTRHLIGITLLLILASGAAHAQWDPGNGQWGKSDPADLRVMTWNVSDAICSTNDKDDSFSNWNAVVRIIASMKPDVIVLQETADNSGNGTGSGADSVQTLITVADLLLHGGADPFEGGTVGSWVQKYDPDFDMPFVFASSRTDGFNRNLVLSRYPFVDLNGDGKEIYDDIPFIGPNGDCAPGGNGGIRGVQVSEIDLPDEVYAGDLVILSGHLKAGGDSDDHDQRVTAAQNAGYFLHYGLNGAGTGQSDPEGNIFESPSIQTILDDFTPALVMGDLNEDEQRNGGTRGPADWFANGCSAGGSDGNDRDLSDMTIDDAREPFTNSRATIGSSKLDYILYQDSIAQLRRAFLFNSSPANANGGIPPELATFPVNPALASSIASDHLPVIVDLILEPAGVDCPADLTGDGVVDASDFFAYLDLFAAEDPDADITGDGTIDGNDFFAYLDLFAAGC